MWGIGTIDGQRVAIGLFDFHFMGGSMGSVVGEKLARCFEAALVERIPAIVVSASGGARMQEGTLSLLQLAKTTAPLDPARRGRDPVHQRPHRPDHRWRAGQLRVAGRRDPRRAEGADRLRRARVSRAGRWARSCRRASRALRSLLEHGFVDEIVPRPELRATLSRLLRLLPVAAVEDGWQTAGEARGWGPIGMLSGMAERLGGGRQRDDRDRGRASAGGNGSRAGRDAREGEREDER